uniref:Putative secreted protein ovary overexpressed n=1 Tax=Rhipicephalus microplus TaxID=6941 RepID=A0A6M2DC28_RHIMP
MCAQTFYFSSSTPKRGLGCLLLLVKYIVACRTFSHSLTDAGLFSCCAALQAYFCDLAFCRLSSSRAKNCYRRKGFSTFSQWVSSLTAHYIYVQKKCLGSNTEMYDL